MKLAKSANYLNCICRRGVTELIHFLSPNTVTASALTPVVVSKMKILKCLSCRSAALEMIKTGEIRDGKTVLLLNYLQMSHLMD